MALDPLIIVALVGIAAAFFVLITWLQRSGEKHPPAGHGGPDHDHGHCHHDHDHDHDHKGGDCCGGHHHHH